MNISLVVNNQLPDFVRSEYDTFVLFIKKYYEWLDTEFPYDIGDIVSFHNSPEEYKKYFYKYLDVFNIFRQAVPFDEKYISYITQLYLSKGTEQALKYIIKSVHNTNVEINYPYNQVLIPSSGEWNQLSFITCFTLFGSIPDTINEVILNLGVDSVEIKISSFEVYNNELRLYYNINEDFDINLVENVQIYDTDTLLYVGNIIPSPSYLRILDGGQDWSTGQVIIFPGAIRNTIARVESITTEGSIKNISIVEYGFGHSDGDFLIISPYKTKPATSGTSLTSTLISVNPLSYHYDLSIEDRIIDIVDISTGLYTGSNPNQYSLENYASNINITGDIVSNYYNASKVFNNISQSYEEPNSADFFDPNLSFETWQNSRAILEFKFEQNANLKGKYVSNGGHLSDDYIRLQDNYFYQKFSYEVESSVNYDVYDDIAKYCHPAGRKRFNKYILENVVSFTILGETNLPFKSIGLLDITNLSDTHYFTINKSINEEQLLTTEDLLMNLDKILPDETINITSTDTESYIIESYGDGTWDSEIYASYVHKLTLGV